MERSLYEPIKEMLEYLLIKIYPGKEIRLEITADRGFSNKLKSQIPDNLEIVFQFLKDIKPDITGYIKQDYLSEIIVVEIKNEPIKIDHIYQIKRYAELLNAKYALLISTYEIPEEIKRLCKKVYSILSLPAYNRITLVYYHREGKAFKEWFEEIPFR